MEPIDLIERARHTLEANANAALATVSSAGLPWNSPVYVAYDANLTFYWSSRHDAEHSKNIAAHADVFIVVFDSAERDASGRAVYVRASARELTSEAEIKRALDCLAARKRERPKEPADFVGTHPRRVYEAVPSSVWTNVVKQQAGHYFDERVAIDLRRTADRSLGS
jgi:hypothetical protein